MVRGEKPTGNMRHLQKVAVNGSYMVSIYHSEKEWVLAPPLKVLVVLYLPKFMLHMSVRNKFSMAM